MKAKGNGTTAEKQRGPKRTPGKRGERPERGDM